MELIAALCVQGIGGPPQRMPVSQVAAAVNESESLLLEIRNPFARALVATFDLQPLDVESEYAFKVLRRQPSVTIGKLSTVQIPVAFTPPAMRNYNADMLVTLGEELTWHYPIRGVAEITPADRVVRLRCKARQPFDQVVELNLGSGYALSLRVCGCGWMCVRARARDGIRD